MREMKMLQPTLRSLSCGVLLLAAACSPPHVHEEEAGPDFSLSAADSVAEFDISVCVDAPRRVTEITSANLYVEADILVADGTRTGLVLGALDGAMDDREQDELDLDAPRGVNGEDWEEDSLVFDLDAENEWDADGRQCSEPQRIRFEYTGEEPTTSLSVEWRVTFIAEFFSRGFRAVEFEEDEVTITIEPVA